MFWQWLIVLICVALAAAYVVRAVWRTWHPKAGGCGGGCGCATPAETPRETLIPAEQLTLRRRER
jgi:hypothetical protein